MSVVGYEVEPSVGWISPSDPLHPDHENIKTEHIKNIVIGWFDSVKVSTYKSIKINLDYDPYAKYFHELVKKVYIGNIDTHIIMYGSDLFRVECEIHGDCHLYYIGTPEVLKIELKQI